MSQSAGVLWLVLGSVLASCPQQQTGLVSFQSKMSKWTKSPPVAWTPLGGGPWHVVIPANTRAVVDVAAFEGGNILVKSGASLIFSDPVGGIEFNTTGIRVEPGASLIAGSMDCPIENKLTITVKGNRPATKDLLAASVLGTDESVFHFGHKGIAVCSGASVQLHGRVDGPSWTRLGATAKAGATAINLQQPVQWRAGDRIVIATTDFPGERTCEYPDSQCDPDQTEQHVVASLSSNGKRVFLTQPLRYDHWGQDGSFGEVGLLTRHIVLRGDTTEEFGGHLMMRKVTKAQIRGVEVVGFGQLGVLGRYPIHFHKLGVHGDGVGMYVKHVSLHHLFQRCVTIHDTRHVEISDNVAFETRGHCYFLEDATEVHNTLVRNLGINAQPIEVEDMTDPYNSERFPLPSDERPAIFWITNPQNAYEGNAAVGANFGYWFSMPTQPNGESIGEYPELLPRNIPLTLFRNNVAHSMWRNGFHVDDMQRPDDETEGASYKPYVMTQELIQKILTAECAYGDNSCVDDIFDGATPAEDVVFDSVTAYKCRGTGVWARGGPFEWRNVLIQDCQRGFLCPPRPNLLRNARIVAESSNKGVHVHKNWLDDYCFADANDCRARPLTWKSDYDMVGYSMYDSGGPQFARNVELVGFETKDLFCKQAGTCQSSGVRRAGAYGHLPNGQNEHFAENAVEGLSFVNSPNRALIEFNRPNAWWPEYTRLSDGPRDGPRNFAVYDRDGSFSNWVGGWVQSDETPSIEDSCEPRPEWNGVVCPPSKHHRAQVRIRLSSADMSKANLNTPPCVQDLSTCVSQGTHSSGCTLCDTFGLDYIRARFYRLGSSIDDALDIMGQPYDEKYRNSYGANLPLRKGYTVRFNHPTPPHMELTFYDSAPGDWVVWAVPYPSSTTFTVLNYEKKELSPATSLAEIDRDHYYWDSADKHLYVMVFREPYSWMKSDTRWGFKDEGGYGRAYVEASCGKSCTVGATLAVPAKLPKLEDSFEAVMETCQADGVPSGVQQGTAFASYQESTRIFHWTIHHNLGDAATGAKIVHEDGSVVHIMGDGAAPIRGSREITNRMWRDVYLGKWSFVITTTAHPNGELKGKVGCVGTCAKPLAASTGDPCNPAGKAVYPLARELSDGTSFLGKWDPLEYDGGVFQMNTSVADALCDDIVSVAFQNNVDHYKQTLAQGDAEYAWGFIQAVWASDQEARAYRIDLNTYKYLEFYIRGGTSWPKWSLEFGFESKSTSGYPYPEAMGWTGWDEPLDEGRGKLVVKPEHMDNGFIDDQWTKVSIPLSDFGFPDSGYARVRDMRMWENSRWRLPLEERWFHIDELRFTSRGDTFTTRISDAPFMHSSRACLSGGSTTWTDRKVDESTLPHGCIGTYSNWQQCTTQCTQKQTFSIIRAPSNGGTACPKANHRACQDGMCTIDCAGNWGTWSECLPSCQKTRTFTIDTHANDNGQPCPHPTETVACSGGQCKQDCQGEHEPEFGSCSAQCTKTKRFLVSQQPSNGGQACAADIVTACTGDACQPQGGTDKDCSGYWDESAVSWTQCSASCKRSKPYVISQPKVGNGKECDFVDGQTMDDDCYTGDCVADCQVEWHDSWAQCDAGCQQTLSYDVIVAANSGGAPCPAIKSQPCSDGLCVRDCVIQLGLYPFCPLSCDRLREHEVLAPAQNGGVACQDLPNFPQMESCWGGNCTVSQCNVQLGSWGECLASNSTASCQRERSVTLTPKSGVDPSQCAHTDVDVESCTPVEFVELCKCTQCSPVKPSCEVWQQLVITPPRADLAACCETYSCQGSHPIDSTTEPTGAPTNPPPEGTLSSSSPAHATVHVLVVAALTLLALLL